MCFDSSSVKETVSPSSTTSHPLNRFISTFFGRSRRLLLMSVCKSLTNVS